MQIWLIRRCACRHVMDWWTLPIRTASDRIYYRRWVTVGQCICKNFQIEFQTGWNERTKAYDVWGRLEIVPLHLQNLQRKSFGLSFNSGEIFSICFYVPYRIEFSKETNLSRVTKRDLVKINDRVYWVRSFSLLVAFWLVVWGINATLILGF